jgi:hypothetical protein
VNRQSDAHDQSMRLSVVQRQRAAMREHDGIRNGKAEAEALIDYQS